MRVDSGSQALECGTVIGAAQPAGAAVLAGPSDSLSLSYQKFKAAVTRVVEGDIPPIAFSQGLPLPLDRGERTTGNKAELLLDGKFFDALATAIQGATKQIDLETFIFDRDETAWRVARQLAEKAKQGVRVRVLYDQVGTYGAGKLSLKPDEIFDYMKAHGVEVVSVAPVKSNRPKLLRVLDRVLTFPSKESLQVRGLKVDHRKIVVVDGKVSMTGGMNIGDEYAKNWHDVMVQVEGPIVQKLASRFEEAWRLHGGKAAQVPPPSAPVGTSTARTIATGYNERSAQQAFYQAVDTARERIVVEVPYLTDDDLTERLVKAAQRGVKVQIIVPDPAINNHGYTGRAARTAYPALMKAGAEIYHYAGRMTHVKAMAVDNAFATVGSTNGTHRSFRNNHELNLVFEDEATVRDIKQKLLDKDLAASQRVTRIPDVSLWDKFCDLVDANF